MFLDDDSLCQCFQVSLRLHQFVSDTDTGIDDTATLTPMEGDKVEVVKAKLETKRLTENSSKGPALFHFKFLQPSPEEIKRHIIPDDLPKNKTNAHLTACFCKYRKAALHERAEKILLSSSRGNIGVENQMELLRILREMVRIIFAVLFRKIVGCRVFFFSISFQDFQPAAYSELSY